MVQRRQYLRFTGEACEAIGICSEGCGQDFDGNVARELGVGGAPHLAHPAFPQLGDDPVMGDRLVRTHKARFEKYYHFPVGSRATRKLRIAWLWAGAISISRPFVVYDNG